MKKIKIVSICFILVFLVSIASVQAGLNQDRIKDTGAMEFNEFSGTERYSSVVRLGPGDAIVGVMLNPWFCWSVTIGRYRDFGEGVELFGAFTGDLCFGTGLGEYHELRSYWNSTVYFDDGVVVTDIGDPLIRQWSYPLNDVPDFIYLEGNTNPNLYTITKIEVHEDKYVDGVYYEYSGTVYVSSSQSEH